MSVTISIEAIIPHNGELFRRYRSVLESCQAAGLAPPTPVAEFFYDDSTSTLVVNNDGKHVNLYNHSSKSGDGVMYGDGIFINLSKLPEGTTTIRVYCDG